MSSRALFLDRDGTLVHRYHYPSRPDQLHLYDNLGSVLHNLRREQNFKVIIITNQAGLAHGYFTEEDLRLMHEYLTHELALLDVQVDGIYYCPHHPNGSVKELARVCDCRKPQPGMLLQAAKELDLNLEHSWFVGDILDDVEAGNRAGCRTVLVDLGTEALPTHQLRVPTFVASSTLHALDLIQHVETTPTPNLVYRPATWSVREAAGATRG
jgi:D-glycero-D-manno-heptose 1,7-bisphosphate phosphatase